MKILFVAQSLKKAGAERMLVNICNELVKDKKNEIVVFLMKMINEFQNELDSRVIISGGDSEIRFSLSKKNVVRNYKFIEYINTFKPDIIHSHLLHADLFAHSYYYKDAVYVSHLQNSIVKEYDGFDSGGIFTKTMWANFYEYCWIISRYKKFKTNFIACSAGAFKLHKERIRIGDIITLPNASPLPRNQQPRAILGNLLNLIWVGRFTDVKRPQLAIQIAKLLKEKGIRFHLKMLGGGLEMDICKKLISEESLSENIQLCGLIDDMLPFYKGADLMIHTSQFEGLPLVFTEANSHGIPIVTTNCMPENEFLVHLKNGLLINSSNPSDFVDGISKIIESPNLYLDLSRNAVEHSKKFGMENYMEKLLKFYSSIGLFMNNK